MPNGLELSCPAETGKLLFIVAHVGGPGAPTYPLARRVSFSELLGARVSHPEGTCRLDVSGFLTMYQTVGPSDPSRSWRRASNPCFS
jgi:hypothetical protein